jgi:hypothetical protein
MAKTRAKKAEKVRFEFYKDAYNYLKEYEKLKFTPVSGGGYVEIGSNPYGTNMFKGIWDGWQETKKDPIEEWVERWIDELGTVK